MNAANDDTSPLIQNSFKLFLFTHPIKTSEKIYLDDVLSMIEHVLPAQALIRHPSSPVRCIHLDTHNIRKTLCKDHEVLETIDIPEIKITVYPEFERWKY
ncbi:hypothetical protein XFPR_12240 [Xylella fastidiosa]|nr:hypothetical protein [Xylella fastidiosa]MDG5823236.1 hypothetical protein [Xylella fastidiosa subsp. pauca]MDG5826511.1 hypothetical protein [Xylella fastidiosa subsp. pauca]QPB72957.1 hypothetical protein XFPR_12240 [Xylella fastidiosa]WGZ36682.1 hypothetical protein O4443_00190 [Xylella fastidiosa subsp. pauca]